MGTLLYLMVTGRRPFEGETDMEIMVKVQRADFPGPEQANPDLPEALCLLLNKAMSRLPEDRFQSAEEALVEIESLQRNYFPQPAKRSCVDG